MDGGGAQLGATGTYIIDGVSQRDTRAISRNTHAISRNTHPPRQHMPA